jgi:hypothetical protein
MSGLTAVGELPPKSRGTSGRKPGRWRGHEDLAEELRVIARREQDPGKRWGRIDERVPEYTAQARVAMVKKGEAVGFEHTPEGRFEAESRKSKNQNRAPVNPQTGKPRVLYDVWARFAPAGEGES